MNNGEILKALIVALSRAVERISMLEDEIERLVGGVSEQF